MLAWEKLKESFISVIPIIILVSLLQFILPQLRHAYPAFLLGGFLLIIGLGIFLVGTELSIVPVGQKTGAALTARRSLLLMLGVAFIVGFLATVAEPDVQVLADQVEPELLASGPYRRGDLLKLCGGEYEYDVLRRFLDGLQEGIECRGGEHVDLVDDVDLVP